MKVTITIQIGNSDDKLSQRNWAEFVDKINKVIEATASEVYFFGAPHNYAQWQNAAWIFSCDEEIVDVAKNKFIEIRKSFLQDSIAFTICDMEFI
jgi:hypothetical protein